LTLVLLLHLRPCLVRGLLFGSFVGFALLPPASHGSDGCAYGCACPCISGDPADYLFCFMSIVGFRKTTADLSTPLRSSQDDKV
jgi:hypothetical protein